jgi:hypothetical protein
MEEQARVRAFTTGSAGIAATKASQRFTSQPLIAATKMASVGLTPPHPGALLIQQLPRPWGQRLARAIGPPDQGAGVELDHAWASHSPSATGEKGSLSWSTEPRSCLRGSAAPGSADRNGRTSRLGRP